MTLTDATAASGARAFRGAGVRLRAERFVPDLASVQVNLD